jgi:hypothetical protein
MIDLGFPERHIEERDSVYSPDMNHRLSLFFVTLKGAFGSNFHELVWEEKRGAEWHARRTISAKEFQLGSSLQRWLCQLFSFEPNSSSAIVRVGTVDSPDPRHYNAVYMWCSLNLMTLELKTLQVLSDPDDPYLG